MIIVRANARNTTYISDDLITSGSVGIPVTFNLSEDFDGLSAIAVFEGSGVRIDVALMGNTCVVPHEVVATAGGYLRIGIYASNSAGTIVIPTVWAGSKMILPGTTPSEVDPSEPTPSWAAQVQEAAAEALQTANNVLDMTVEADTLAPGSEASVEKTVDPDGAVTLTFGIPRGDTGATGPQGEDGISPTITITDITGGHRVTITDATGPHSFDVMDGEGAVQDVQVAGVSVLSDGVANVPIATPTTPGVVTSGTITVTGSTPTITALPGIRYVCGEVATLDITLPASGIVDVMFESGSTPTVLTITPPTGVTLRWANGFDPTNLEAGTTYEINIADGLGVAASWT